MTRAVARAPSLWERHARQFERMGPPLRPSPEDTEVMRAEVRRRRAEGLDTRVLVMGVTPEVADLGAHTLAVDLNPAMIRGVWPGYRVRPDSYVCASWESLPLPDASRDLVFCDGGLTLLEFPEGYAAWSEAVRRVLTPGGSAVVRLFVRPDEPEGPDEVLTELERGGFESFHAFRWRLAMSLQADPATGVAVHDVWSVWDREGRDALARSPSDWPDEVVRTIDAYRDADARLRFPTLDEAREGLGAALVERSCTVPRYELGARCPSLVLDVRGR